jgi:hypothetical protein
VQREQSLKLKKEVLFLLVRVCGLALFVAASPSLCCSCGSQAKHGRLYGAPGCMERQINTQMKSMKRARLYGAGGQARQVVGA